MESQVQIFSDLQIKMDFFQIWLYFKFLAHALFIEISPWMYKREGEYFTCRGFTEYLFEAVEDDVSGTKKYLRKIYC